jgi:flagellin-like hook-associated protein FlgL
MLRPQNPFSNKSNRVPDINHDTQQKAAEELSSGYRRNLIKKYTPDSTHSASFQEQLDAINHAIDQAKAELSLVQTKDNALAKIQDLLIQLRKLAVLAKQPSLTRRDRAAINSKAKQLQNEIDRISFTINQNSP